MNAQNPVLNEAAICAISSVFLKTDIVTVVLVWVLMNFVQHAMNNIFPRFA